MSNAIQTHDHLAELIDSDRKNYRRLFYVTFMFFVLIAAVGRLLPKSWRPAAPDGHGRETVFEEAQRTANTILPFLFIR
jgi:hypothetical protein